MYTDDFTARTKREKRLNLQESRQNQLLCFQADSENSFPVLLTHAQQRRIGMFGRERADCRHWCLPGVHCPLERRVAEPAHNLSGVQGVPISARYQLPATAVPTQVLETEIESDTPLWAHGTPFGPRILAA